MNIKFLIYLLTFIFFVGCNTVPQDLENKKIEINERLEELRNSEKEVSGNKEYEKLISDYEKLKTELIAYTADANGRGISKNNYRLIEDIDSRIQRLKQLTTPQVSYNDAERFVQEIISHRGGAMLDGFTSNNYEAKLYIFLVTYGGQTCNITVSELKLEILATKCGDDAGDLFFQAKSLSQ